MRKQYVVYKYHRSFGYRFATTIRAKEWTSDVSKACKLSRQSAKRVTYRCYSRTDSWFYGVMTDYEAKMESEG